VTRASDLDAKHLVTASFLQVEPVIDGCLTPEKEALPARPFDHLLEPAPGSAPGDATLRLAYGASFLYVLVQHRGDRFTCRDRGYQNGDGLVVVLARPRPDRGPSDEYSMLAFWPQDDPIRPFRTMLWGTNGRWPLTPLPSRVRHAVGVERGVVSLEALIPWEEVPPHHPWLSDEIGIDILFARAVEDDKTEVRAIAIEDPSQSSPDHALYRMCSFASPHLESGSQLFVRGRRNIGRGDDLELQTAALSSDRRAEELVLRLYSGEGDYVQGHKLHVQSEPGLSLGEHSVALGTLPPGGYRVRWHCLGNPSEGEFGLTVLAPFDPEDDARRLERLGAGDDLLSNTIRFHAEQILGGLKTARPYETCSRLHPPMEAYSQLIRAAEANRGLFAEGGIVRLAHRSTLDQTLQPFTVLLPDGFDPERSYPLLVHLHGSDRDDTELAGFLSLYHSIEAIVLAPFGRGTTNSFVKDNAQDDIREAIGEACRVLPIDKDRIVLAGFSMGGYGVYHTYATSPNTYRAFAPFSGTPSAAWEPTAPDYASDELLSTFVGVPMFVFHGTGDFNVSFAATEKLIAALRERGHEEIVVCLESGGHNLPGEESTVRFHEWLKKILDS